MDRIGGHLTYNLDTKSLPITTRCYILRVTVQPSNILVTLRDGVPVTRQTIDADFARRAQLAYSLREDRACDSRKLSGQLRSG